MKSTPTRGVKQFLKPDAYKQSEPSLQIIRECAFARHETRGVNPPHALMNRKSSLGIDLDGE